MRYVQGIQPNKPEGTTAVDVYMNVPTYLVAQNLHGPRFTPPPPRTPRKYA